MSEPVLTVKQEVEAILRDGLRRSQERVDYFNTLGVDGVEDWHEAVLNELRAIIEAYVNPPKGEPERREFQAGDYVRLTGENWSGGGDPAVGDIVLLEKIDGDGDGVFHDEDGEEWYTGSRNMEESGYGAEFVTDSEIRVGDTVRIKEGVQTSSGVSIYGQGNEAGVEFEVTEVVESSWSDTTAGQDYKFYVHGDPARRGIWDIFIDKVVR